MGRFPRGSSHFLLVLGLLQVAKNSNCKTALIGHLTSKDFPVKISENMIKGSGLVVAKWVQRILTQGPFTPRGGVVQQYTAPQRLRITASFVIPRVLQWLEKNDREQTEGPLIEALHGTQTHRASLRCAEETGTRKPPQQRSKEKCLCAAPAHVHPARSTDWPHDPCLAPAPCFS